MFKVSRSLLYFVRFKSNIGSKNFVWYQQRKLNYEIIIHFFVKYKFPFIIQYPISTVLFTCKIFINCKNLFILT